MKNQIYTLLIVFVFISFTSPAQSVFHENFENPDSVTTSGNFLWTPDNIVQVSGVYCTRGNAALGDTSYLTTASFSTIGFYHVVLSFYLINTLATDEGLVEVSYDSGSTWHTLGVNDFQTNSQISFNGYFNGYSTPYWCGLICCNAPWTNLEWVKANFDLSNYTSNSQNVMVRFKLLGVQGCTTGGWYIDDININAQPYSITSTPSCFNDGTATITPYFGTAPYTYSWNTTPIQTTPTIVNMDRGFYTCTVTDNNGISYTDSIEIKSVIQANISVVDPVCQSTYGSLSVYGNSPNGGLSYTIVVNDGTSGTQYVSLMPGVTALIYITDQSGCVFQETDSFPCTFNGGNIIMTTTPSACTVNNGTAYVQNLIGGTPPFTYWWHTIPPQYGDTCINLAGGSINYVSVYDSIGDSAVTYFYIPFADTLNANIIYTPTTCNTSTGTATINVRGGITPYTYSWNTVPPQNTQTVNNLSNTYYSCTATDSNGCTAQAYVSIPANTTLQAYPSNTTCTCNQSNGTATLSVSGGVPPYTYSWTGYPAATTNVLPNIPQGNYYVTVTDFAGCSKSETCQVYPLSAMQVYISQVFSNCSCISATATVTNSIGSVSFLWDDGTTNATDTCLSPGYHYVKVTDSSGCSAAQSINAFATNNCYIDIDGYVYCDVNYNCNYDVTEYPIANVPININGVNNSYATNTDNNGYYHFHVLNDIYNLTQYVPAHFHQLCPMPAVVIINIPTGTTIQTDFADSADTYFDDAEIISCYDAPVTRGFNDMDYISIVNSGTNVLSGNTFLILDPAQAFINAFPAGTYSIPTRTITWTYSNLVPGEVRTYTAVSLLSAAAPLGSLVFDTTTVTPLISDVTPFNNVCHSVGVVRGAYDPNYKITIPEGAIQKDSLWQSYLIHFQNTGNSYAMRVVVEDTLDVNLDASTICDFSSSHAFTIDTSALPLVRFIFDNIQLPDSTTNFGGSQGYISFRIQHYPGLNQGIIISNQAEIYFDFNPAIITNTVTSELVNVVGLISPEKNEAVQVYPNPANSFLNLHFPEVLTNNSTFELMDVLGKIIYSTNLESGNKQYHISISGTPEGIYFYLIKKHNQLINTGKIVIVK